MENAPEFIHAYPPKLNKLFFQNFRKFLINKVHRIFCKDKEKGAMLGNSRMERRMVGRMKDGMDGSMGW
jgi:hypothetical protein